MKERKIAFIYLKSKKGYAFCYNTTTMCNNMFAKISCDTYWDEILSEGAFFIYCSMYLPGFQEMFC